VYDFVHNKPESRKGPPAFLQAVLLLIAVFNSVITLSAVSSRNYSGGIVLYVCILAVAVLSPIGALAALASVPFALSAKAPTWRLWLAAALSGGSGLVLLQAVHAAHRAQ